MNSKLLIQWPVRVLAICFLLLSLASCQSANDKAEALLKDYWVNLLALDPEHALFYSPKNAEIDKLTPYTEEHFEAANQLDQEYLNRAQAIDKNSLSKTNRINLQLFILSLENSITERQFKTFYMPLGSFGGSHNGFIRDSEEITLKSKKDVASYVSRIQNFVAKKDQTLAMLKKGIELGMVGPADGLKDVEKTFTAIVDTPAKESRLLNPLKKMKDLSNEERLSFENDIVDAIENSFYPAVAEMGKFFNSTYKPALRNKPGVDSLPRGKEFYEFVVRKFTTTDLTPDEIHNIGLSEVKRIRSEMMMIIKSVEWKGDFQSFIKDLRTNPKFYPKTKQELLEKVSFVLKKMDGKLPELFKKLPRSPYGIKEVPASIAPLTATAFYNPPNLEGTRAGFYYVNTYDLKSRPLYEIEALSLHEAVPGHHLQLALMTENSEKPEFLRTLHFTAYIEGWGLYAEALGKEVGFYEDPYSDFGRLSYEMWRALRLVVDTGIHSKGWSKEKAVQYMLANSALTEQNIRAEVKRYISWPGQALAYKIGQLKILELRAKAKKEMGDRYAIRDFHDVVLRNGALPLDLLANEVDAYIKTAH